MILDKHRFQLWLKDANITDDIRDTIEDLMEFYDCGDEMKAKDKEIEDLKKQIEDLKTTKLPPSRALVNRYEAQGNSFPVKDFLKQYRFRWDGDAKVWFLRDEGMATEQAVKECRALLKERGIQDVDIVFIGGK